MSLGNFGKPSKPGSRALASVLVIAASLSLVACSAIQGSAPPASESPTGLSGELTIFAAASLTASFTELAEGFSAENPGLSVKPISFDGSSSLATQIGEGAPADVFASADQANMNKVSDLAASEPIRFASNVLQIAVQPGNPLGISRLSDLAKPGVQAVLCAPEVPCGAAARTLLDFDGVTLRPVSEEQNVSAVLTKVKLGEADAGLVYVTDVQAAAGSVDGVTIAGADRAFNSYLITRLRSSKNPQAAAAFVEYVLSPTGAAVLARYGFSSP